MQFNNINSSLDSTPQHSHNGCVSTKDFLRPYKKNEPIVTTTTTDRPLYGNGKVQTMATLVSSVTHELRGYLGAISIYSELSEKPLVNIKKAVKAADCLIGNLLLQIKGIVAGKSSREGFKLYSITKNIEEALEQYPFKTGERELIALETTNDFEYTGNPILTTHVLYNLIKNSLRAVANAGKGKITIKLKSDKKFNRLIFRDTASGISKDFLPKVFGLFESQMTAQGGTGVGLAYCKEIMKSYNGDITCDSVEGQYAEFVLKFPVLSAAQKL
jgi:signal transduction histidine kinase